MRREDERQRSLVITIGPMHDKPWWWEHVKADEGLCPLDYERIDYKGKTSKDITTFELLHLALLMLPKVIRLRKGYSHVFTFECDLTTFIIAFWQTVLFIRRPRHVVLQFITREKSASFKSRLKYAILKLCFASLYRIICSSRSEAQYYLSQFNWPAEKALFVPFHTDPALLAMNTTPKGHYLFSGGRVYRDFDTLVRAVQGGPYSLNIVANKAVADRLQKTENITLYHDLPLARFLEMMAESSVVVVSLEDREISTGQTVILQAMALRKPVIATRTASTVDYIRHMENGLLVDPGDVEGMRQAIRQLMEDVTLRTRLGENAREAVEHGYLPHHYTKLVREALRLEG